MSYDSLLRLYQTVSGAATSRFAYDGLDRIAEHDAANTLQRRYVHGPGIDEPLVWYEGSGTTDRRFLGSDERGSIVSVTDSAGVVLGLNKYDEYGQPQSTNLGVWGYTGQAWLPEISLWHYKARAYDPELGRFLQTDPIGYGDSPNLYAYVLNDPVNFIDPLGLAEWPNDEVWGCRWICSSFGTGAGALAGSVGIGAGGGGDPPLPPRIAQRLEDEGPEDIVIGRRPRNRTGLIMDLIQGLHSRFNRQLCAIGAKAAPGGRIRLGGDVLGYGGIGGGLGAGVSVTHDGRVGLDFYYGWGAGIGAVGGGGLSRDSATPPPGRSSINQVGVSVGAYFAGYSVAYSKPNVQTSGGPSVGPKLGYAAGSIHGTSFATYSESICE